MKRRISERGRRRLRMNRPPATPASDSAPDAEAPLPDGERPPPVRRDLTRGRDEEVDAPADQPGREPPHGDLVAEVGIAAELGPASARDEDGRGHGEDVGQAVGVDEQGTEVEAVVRRARNRRQAGQGKPGESVRESRHRVHRFRHAGNNRGKTSSARVRSTAAGENGSTSRAARSAYPGRGSSSASRTAEARSSPTRRESSLRARSSAG